MSRWTNCSELRLSPRVFARPTAGQSTRSPDMHGWHLPFFESCFLELHRSMSMLSHYRDDPINRYRHPLPFLSSGGRREVRAREEVELVEPRAAAELVRLVRARQVAVGLVHGRERQLHVAAPAPADVRQHRRRKGSAGTSYSCANWSAPTLEGGFVSGGARSERARTRSRRPGTRRGSAARSSARAGYCPAASAAAYSRYRPCARHHVSSTPRTVFGGGRTACTRGSATS